MLACLIPTLWLACLLGARNGQAQASRSYWACLWTSLIRSQFFESMTKGDGCFSSRSLPNFKHARRDPYTLSYTRDISTDTSSMDAALADLRSSNSLSISNAARRHGVMRSALSKRFHAKTLLYTTTVPWNDHRLRTKKGRGHSPAGKEMS